MSIKPTRLKGVDKMKKTVTFILTALLYVYMCTFTASAMPNPDLESIDLVISNIPDECAYIDILVNISESDSYYTDYNSANMKAYDFDTTELKEYESGGFVSFSCHCKDAQTDMNIREKMTMTNHEITKQLIADRKRVQIAVLDKNGHILQTSMPVLIKEDDSFLYGNIKYDVDGNTVDPDIYESSNYSGLLIFLLLVGLFLILEIGLLFYSIINTAGKKKTVQQDGAVVATDSMNNPFANTLLLAILFMTVAAFLGAIDPIGRAIGFLSVCFIVAPAILTLIVAAITDRYRRLIIPDIAYIFVLTELFGDLKGYLIILLPIMLAVQILIILLAVMIQKHKSKKREGRA